MDFLFLVLAILLVSEISALPQGILFASLNVKCLNVGSKATASWTNEVGETCTWTGYVGSNFGINPRNNRRLA